MRRRVVIGKGKKTPDNTATMRMHQSQFEQVLFMNTIIIICILLC
jgi:hypothetical protein